jgi:adenylate cyclase
MLMILASLSGVAGVVWGVILLALGETAGLLALGYVLISVPALVFWRRSKRLELLIWIQLFLITGISFLLALALGGYVGSGAVVLWSFLGPIGALLFLTSRQAAGFLVVFFGLLVALAFAYPDLEVHNGLPDWVILLFFVLNIGVASAVVFGLFRYFVLENRRIHELLEIEQGRSEALLSNVLPAVIAEQLKDTDRTVAEHYESVSVLFADLVGFTPLAETLSAEELVETLNTMFTRFDELVTSSEAEKIGTIGDSYMVVAGAPQRHADHAGTLANLALEMMKAIDSAESVMGSKLTFRMGINTGPIVAGVIGTTRLHYDVWGDTVNVASRLESHGVPGRIQISQSTHEAIEDRFACTHRGVIEIKGKGSIDTWFLDGPLPA